MALVTPTSVEHLMPGSRREVIITLDLTAATGHVMTGLGWVEEATMQAMDANDNEVSCFPNSITASATMDDPGYVYFSGTATANRYRMHVTGR